MKKNGVRKVNSVIADNPLEGEQLLLDALYGQRAITPRPVKNLQKAKPEHYKVVSISLYREDIDHLNELVRELKRRGHYKANKSQLIRHALAQVNLDLISRER
jgi:hypothetical protein